jgi:hypothetical protein
MKKKAILDKPGSFRQHSLTCDCDPDRLIEDHNRELFCGTCMEPLEKVDSKELTAEDQRDILLKLKLRKKIATQNDTVWKLTPKDFEDDDEI